VFGNSAAFSPTAEEKPQTSKGRKSALRAPVPTEHRELNGPKLDAALDPDVHKIQIEKAAIGGCLTLKSQGLDLIEF
jgi:hypothetical protein